MHSGPLRPALGVLGLTQIQYVRPVRRGAATGLVAQVYRQVESDFGILAPPIALHARSPQVLAAAWMMLRETLVVPGRLSRATKEAVATDVSRSNTCPYCVTIHGSLAGRLRSSASGPAGATDPEAITVAVVMHYINRMVNVFLREVPLPPGVPKWTLGPVMRVLGNDMLAAARGSLPAGASLPLLPMAEVSGELTWTVGGSPAAEALERASVAIEEAGRRSLPNDVRELVEGMLAGWKGEPMGISRAWTDPLLADLPADRRPTGRLALLVAFASFQVDSILIQHCRISGFDDAALINVSAWSALAAARRLGQLAHRNDLEG